MIPVRSYTRRRWYHGSSKLGAKSILKEGIIRPGMPTKYRQDIPRSDAVYVTTDLETARGYAGSDNAVFEVEVEEHSLIPDEDAVFGALESPGPLHDRVKRAWIRSGKTMRDFHWFGETAMEDPFSTVLAEEMKQLAEYIADNDPKLAVDLIAASTSAAHLGSVKVKRQVKQR